MKYLKSMINECRNLQALNRVALLFATKQYFYYIKLQEKLLKLEIKLSQMIRVQEFSLTIHTQIKFKLKKKKKRK